GRRTGCREVEVVEGAPVRAARGVVVDGDHAGQRRAVGGVAVALAELPAAGDVAVDRAGLLGVLHQLLDVDHVDHLRGAVVVGVGRPRVAAADGPEHDPVVVGDMVPGPAVAGPGLGAGVLRSPDVTVPDLDLCHAVVPDLLLLRRS